jgi:alpha-L-arabinofuranosidase
VLQVANAGTESISATFTLDFAVSGPASVAYIAPGSNGLYDTSNTLDNPNLVVPQTKSVTLKGNSLNYTFPEMSVTVIKFAVSGSW